jgi:beta-lactamase superfamily II metal-dependent hydrolase
MFNGKLSGYISNHPFIFLISLAILASCLMGGTFLISGKGRNGPVQSIATTAATATPVQEATATSTAVAPTPTVTLAPTASMAPLVVTFIDVGQGDSILIESPDGQIALIDGGSAGSGALTYLQNRGIKSIDIMIATYPGGDHIGGLSEVLDAMPVRKVFTNAQSDTTTTYRHFLDAIANAKAEYEEVTRGDAINLGNLTFSVLNPDAIKVGNLKTNSLVLRMSYGRTAFLFMGDADKAAEAGTLAAVNLVQADILKVGQHGSCAASSPAFLDAVHPMVAIYFAKAKNPYGYPCAATIRALDARGTFVYGTDNYGSITVTVSVDGYDVSSASGLLFRR